MCQDPIRALITAVCMLLVPMSRNTKGAVTMSTTWSVIDATTTEML